MNRKKRLRWLLVMDQTGQGAAESSYRLALQELDEPEPSAPLRFQTVDELYQALINRWERNSPPDNSERKP